MTPLPFTVIGGFLGAGKTTLLNDLLARTRGERIAVLVNDFGSIAIDAALIAGHDGDTIALTNGCICCAVGGEFVAALPPLLTADPPFDRVVVEASGVSDPARIAQYGTLPGFRLDGVIVVVDAAGVIDQFADDRVAPHIEQQLRAAHVVVLTKVDLVDAPRLADVRDAVRSRRADVTMIESGSSVAAADALFDSGGHDPVGGGAPPHHGFDTAAYTAAAPLDRPAFEQHLAAWPAEVVRAKGIVRFAGADEPSTVHVVGSRRRITTGPAVSVEGGGSLVVIGLPGAVAGLPPPPGMAFHRPFT